jgi:hypothetical protein
MKSLMSFSAKQELASQMGCRYRESNKISRKLILDEFVASTGYNRKYAISILNNPIQPKENNQKKKYIRYDENIQEILIKIWSASNYICSKRLVPFLPSITKSLEFHGHITLTEIERTILFGISAATIDRILQKPRKKLNLYGRSTTKRGTLLKSNIPVRTFACWNDLKPGFLEIDLVAHCGTSVTGTYLNTLVLTDIATCWTEYIPLMYKSSHTVIQGIELARKLLPFPLLGLDTDNGSEFINNDLITYCKDTHITFTRGRPYKKNDQCYVEQKNGNIIRQYVGYDRFEGEGAFQQLTELYKAMRLYCNYFQPSMKLKTKHRNGAKVTKKYDQAQTPMQRLIDSLLLKLQEMERLQKIHEALDPIKILNQMKCLLESLWKYACTDYPSEEKYTEKLTTNSSDIQQGILQRFKKVEKPKVSHNWRTRKDPFEEVWDQIVGWLNENSEQTAKAILERLHVDYPGQYKKNQLRTLQRKIKTWRSQVILEFNDTWLQEEITAGRTFPLSLTAKSI